MFTHDELTEQLRSTFNKKAEAFKYYDIDDKLYVKIFSRKIIYYKYWNENEFEDSKYIPPFYIDRLYEKEESNYLYIAQSEEDCSFLYNALGLKSIYIESCASLRNNHIKEILKTNNIVFFTEHNLETSDRQTKILSILKNANRGSRIKSEIIVANSPCLLERYSGNSPVKFTFDKLIFQRMKECFQKKI